LSHCCYTVVTLFLHWFYTVIFCCCTVIASALDALRVLSSLVDKACVLCTVRWKRKAYAFATPCTVIDEDYLSSRVRWERMPLPSLPAGFRGESCTDAAQLHVRSRSVPFTPPHSISTLHFSSPPLSPPCPLARACFARLHPSRPYRGPDVLEAWGLVVEAGDVSAGLLVF
jgi:hypothetical protein